MRYVISLVDEQLARQHTSDFITGGGGDVRDILLCIAQLPHGTGSKINRVAYTTFLSMKTTKLLLFVAELRKYYSLLVIGTSNVITTGN